MPTFTIWRAFTFEAAHHLPHVSEGHKCGRPHGHSYRVRLELRGPADDWEGWVRDFADVDAAVAPIRAQLDHQNLNDVLPNPTSEMLTLWLFKALKRALPELHAVEVNETERSGARYEEVRP